MSQKKSQKPKARRKVRGRDSDEEVEFESTGARSKNEITDLERERLVGDLMRYMLFADLHKQVVPKRDISTKVMGEYAKKRNVINEVINEAQIRFTLLFGFDMVELPKVVTKRTAGIVHTTTDANQSSGNFILINTAADKDKKNLNFDRQGPVMGLLMTILALIQLQPDNKIDQELMYTYLAKLGLDRFQRDHPIFGDWMDVIDKQFVKQQYLKKLRVPDVVNDNGGDVYEYHFGLRTVKEIPKVNIARFICAVFGEELTDVEIQDLEEEMEEESDEEE